MRDWTADPWICSHPLHHLSYQPLTLLEITLAQGFSTFSLLSQSASRLNYNVFASRDSPKHNFQRFASFFYKCLWKKRSFISQRTFILQRVFISQKTPLYRCSGTSFKFAKNFEKSTLSRVLLLEQITWVIEDYLYKPSF